MKSISQLCRQPMKTVSGILLMTLAVAILCVCAGQAMVAGQLEAAIDKNFTTLALPTEVYQLSSGGYQISPTLPEEVTAWIRQMTADNPDIIKAVAAPGLASAYVPELRQDNLTNYPRNGEITTVLYETLASSPMGAPYSAAILEIALTEVGSVKESDGQQYIKCVGTVEAIVALEAGYPDSAGFTATVTFPLSDGQGAEDFQVGGRYLVYGPDYLDLDWELRSSLTEAWKDGYLSIEFLDPDCLTWYPEEQITKQIESLQSLGFALVYNVASYMDPENEVYFDLTNITANSFNAITITANDYALLSGTAEELMESSGLWQGYLEICTINAQAYPVIGVDKLTHLADFTRGLTTVTTGREFTDEEMESGANVCLISESLAAINGLTVGDTISLSYYAYDESCTYQDSLASGNGVINPAASFYTENTTLAPAQEYTIVGLYQQKYDFYNMEDNLYSITPNTILVPKGGVTVEMQYTEQGLWGALELYNGSVDAFNTLLDEAGYSLLYVCYDQGYSIVKENLQNYDAIAGRAVIIGLTVYGIILVLYLALFPTQQGDAVYRMGTMGTPWHHKMGYILTSGLGILLPGTVLGAACSLLLWDWVVNALAAVVAADLELALDMGTILAISAGQLVLALALTGLVSLPLTLGKLMNRR